MNYSIQSGYPPKKSLINSIVVTLLYFGGIPLFFLLQTRFIPIDLPTYYIAGKFGCSPNINIYQFSVLKNLGERYGIVPFPFLYPPTFILMFRYIFWSAGIRQAIIRWTIVLLAGLLTFSYIFFRHRSKHDTPWFLLVILFILPFDWNFHEGQVNIVGLALISISFHLIWKDSFFLSGLFLGLASAFGKAHLFLLVVPFALSIYKKKGVSSVVYFIIGFFTTYMFAILLSIEVCSFFVWKYFFKFTKFLRYGQSIPGLYSVTAPASFSLASVIARFTSASPSKVSFYTSTLLGLLWGFWLFLHWKKVSFEDYEKNFYLWTGYMLLIMWASPMLYLHQIIFIAFPFAFFPIFREKEHYIVLLISRLASMDWPYLYEEMGITIPFSIRSFNFFLLGLLYIVSLYKILKNS